MAATAGRVAARIAELGLKLPACATPQANYIPFTKTGNLVFVSGQVPMLDGQVTGKGRVGDNVTVEEAQGYARLCALGLIAQAQQACGGDLDKIVRVVKLGAFVCCTNDFTQQPEVVNGASDVLVQVFGDAGRHARFAVGTNALPRGVSVEIDGVFEIAE